MVGPLSKMFTTHEAYIQIRHRYNLVLSDINAMQLCRKNENQDRI